MICILKGMIFMLFYNGVLYYVLTYILAKKNITSVYST